MRTKTTDALEFGLSVRRLPTWKQDREAEEFQELEAISRIVSANREDLLGGVVKATNKWCDSMGKHIALKNGVNYFGSADFCSLVLSARESVGEFVETPPIPSDSGVLWLESPMLINGPTVNLWIRCFTWARFISPMLPPYMSRDEDEYQASTLGLVPHEVLCMNGYGVDSDGDDSWVTSAWRGDGIGGMMTFRNQDLTQFACAAFNILAQDGLIETTDREPEPHEVKRARKKRQKPPETVKVVDLRKRAAAQQAVVADAERTYQHRWVVKGHWRNQSCGPKHTLRRRIYVAPYVKGPDGKPLLTKETVYRW